MILYIRISKLLQMSSHYTARLNLSLSPSFPQVPPNSPPPFPICFSHIVWFPLTEFFYHNIISLVHYCVSIPHSHYQHPLRFRFCFSPYPSPSILPLLSIIHLSVFTGTTVFIIKSKYPRIHTCFQEGFSPHAVPLAHSKNITETWRGWVPTGGNASPAHTFRIKLDSASIIPYLVLE